MKNNSKLFSIALISAALLVNIGCSKEEEDSIAPVVTTPTGNTYQVPVTYTFVDANSISTVDFNGQAQRLEMGSEMIAYIKTGNTVGTFLDATKLKNMYANNAYTWIDAPSLGLTGSTKQLKDKTAEGDIMVQAMLESYMDSLAVLSDLNYSNSAENYGQGGVWTDGTKSYLLSAAGYDYKEFIEKGFMCAIFMNQMTVNYLGTLSDDDNTTLLAGKNYTEMQHHWDEAYGYFTTAIDYPTSGTDRFWGEYTYKREGVLGSATILGNAFRKGRAAIDNKDYTTRDAQIAIIRNEMERVCAGTAISYLNKVKLNINANTLRNHELSEAKGLLDGLRYGYKAISSTGMTATDIDTVLSYINDFEHITITDINNAIDLIASKTGLNDYKSIL